MLKIGTQTFEYMDVGLNEDGEVQVTVACDFPVPDQLTAEDIDSVLNDPLFSELLRVAYHNTPLGTPVWSALERMRYEDRGPNVRFQQLEVTA